MVKIRVALVGYGKITEDQHVPAILANGDLELLAISSTSGKTHPAATYSYRDYNEMREKTPNLDAVAICTPPGPRYAIAQRCLAAGKHILLEKPPAATITEIIDIRQRAADANLTCVATWHAQHNAAVRRAKALLTGKSIKTLNVIWKEDIRRWHPGQEWILEAGGFGIFDPGVNALSILTFILPSPLFIASADLFYPANRGAPIAANLIFGSNHEGAKTLKAELDWRQTGDQVWDIEIVTEDGIDLRLTNGGARLEVIGAPPVEEPNDEYPDIYREFVRLIAAAKSQVEISPFQLVADSFMLGRRTEVDAFSF